MSKIPHRSTTASLPAASVAAGTSCVAVAATQELHLEELLGTAFDDLWAVIVINDDVTTFATVITALVEIFQHTPEAAEALAWTVHRTGRAQVAVGDEVFATDGMDQLHRRGIQATIERLGD